MGDQKHLECVREEEEIPVPVGFPWRPIKIEPEFDDVVNQDAAGGIFDNHQGVVESGPNRNISSEYGAFYEPSGSGCNGKITPINCCVKQEPLFSDEDVGDTQQSELVANICCDSGTNCGPPNKDGVMRLTSSDSVKVEFVKDEETEVDDTELSFVSCGRSSNPSLEEEPTTSTEILPIACSTTQSKLPVVNIHEQGKTTYQCGVCSMTFPTWQRMDKHLQLHLDMTFIPCRHCDRCFLSDLELSVHLQTHFGDTRFRCARCDKCYISKSYFIQHLKDHGSDSGNPYKCSRCGKVYTNSSELRLHFKTHSKPTMAKTRKKDFSSHIVKKIKIFECSVCKKCFLNDRDLSSHTRVHSNTKTSSS